MTRGHAAIGLAVALGLGLLAQPAFAQQPAAYANEPPAFHQAPPPPSPYAGPAVVDPASFAGPGGGAGQPPGGCQNGRCSELRKRLSVCCWSDHNLPICTSGRAQLAFIFGSCRTFFGEPCLCQKPLVPVPPGYQPFPYGTR